MNVRKGCAKLACCSAAKWQQQQRAVDGQRQIDIQGHFATVAAVFIM